MLKVIKASGRTEDFRLNKLVDSLVRSGASPDAALRVAEEVQARVSPLPHTRDIYRLAKNLLREYNHATGMRYSLKRALFSLGPSGYPFERYFARVLAAYGYTTVIDEIVPGRCVSHEVDIVARKDGEVHIIECKYHNEPGTGTDVKVALYVHSRFEDIRQAGGLGILPGTVKAGWLVTNTRCSPDAIKYAECVSLRLVSWKYPASQSLEQMIEGRKLYPVSVLPSAKGYALKTLLDNDIVMAQDITDMTGKEFLRRSTLDRKAAAALKCEADGVCGY